MLNLILPVLILLKLNNPSVFDVLKDSSQTALTTNSTVETQKQRQKQMHNAMEDALKSGRPRRCKALSVQNQTDPDTTASGGKRTKR